VAKRPAGPRKATDDHEAVEELSSRLVFSLLQAAVRVAARVHMPLDRLTELLRTAYFVEYRRRHPRELEAVAEKMGVSLRTAGTLNRSLKGDFFSPETRVEPLRLLTGALLGQPRTADELEAVTGLEIAEVRRGLRHLEEVGWATTDGDGRVELSGNFRSYLNDDRQARVDGVNHQMAVVADSVWGRFIRRNDTTAAARTWSFAARPEDVEALLQKMVPELRAAAIAMEEEALAGGSRERFGMTFAVAPVEDER
jgi:hypothetical protein